MDRTPTSLTPPRAPRSLLRWLWQLARDVVGEYRRDRVGDLAASITFWTILSVPAAVLALVSLLSAVRPLIGATLAEDAENEVQKYFRDTLADAEGLNDAVEELFNSSSAGVATIATVVAVVTLSRAFAGLIRALNVAYEVDDRRPWLRRRIVALGLGVGSIVVVAAAAAVLAVLPSLPLPAFVQVLAAPVTLVVLVLWAATVFHVGPNHKTPWRFDMPGAMLAALGWVVATQAFALYVRVAGHGNQVQTRLGGLLLGLTLMYSLGVVLLVGAELNDVIARRAGVVRGGRQPAEQTLLSRSDPDYGRMAASRGQDADGPSEPPPPSVDRRRAPLR